MADRINVNSDGTVYVGGGFLSSGKRVGRVDDSGNVYGGRRIPELREKDWPRRPPRAISTRAADS